MLSDERREIDDMMIISLPDSDIAPEKAYDTQPLIRHWRQKRRPGHGHARLSLCTGHAKARASCHADKVR